MRRFSIPAWSAVFPAALLLIWPALAVGRPFIFYDSDGYRAAGISILSLLHGIGARLFGGHGPVVESWSMFAAGSAESLSFMGARSPTYGLFLALSEAAGSLWIALYLQALAVAWLVWTWLRAAAPASGVRAYLILVAALAAATSLPFFASFLMPDLFTSVALLGAVLLLVYPDKLSRRSQVAVWLLLAVSLTFHTSNLLALAAVLMLVFAVLVVRTGLRPAARRSAATGAAVLAGLLAAVAYPLAVR
ncbi:hypothetical protein, partial [Caulobacter sp. 17J65-9]|uniref:hypothetical protein n=1 Tax=Caulobacter sp. 17J65-9 TaxID=2709382 RepID=UPI0013C75787